ncbi:MAG: GNAT family N-acetyltransferase [Slackia sp.]
MEKSLLEGGGHAPWAVVMKATGELAGFFGMRPVVEEEERRLKALYVMRSKRFEQGYASEAMQAARRFIERVFVRASAPCERASSSAPKNGLLENLSREEEELLDEYRGVIAATRAALAQEASPANPPAGFRVHGSIVKQFHGLNALSFTFSYIKGAAPALAAMPKTRRPPPAIPANEKRPRANCAGPLRRFEPVP